MGDFKIQGITPAAEKLKLGSLNVSKIYNGSTQVWPSTPYAPIVGGELTFISNKETAPYYGLFDSNFNEISSNFNFSSLPSSNFRIAAVSDNLNYMVAAFPNNFNNPGYISKNRGVSWTQMSNLNARTGHVYMSKSGRVIIFDNTGSGINYTISNDYGESFTNLDLSSLIPSGGTAVAISSISISSDGKVIILNVGINGNYPSDYGVHVFKSTDYGETFVDISSDINPTVGSYQWFTSLVSGDGKYQIHFSRVGPSSWSDDYGETFTNKNYPQTTIGYASINEDGRYFMFYRQDTQEFAYSNDYGESTTFGTIPNSRPETSGVSNSGEHSFAFSDGLASIEYSNDYFNSFTSSNFANGASWPLYIVDTLL
tara:strand:- start:48 stop:1157 length:1110 start_codon:yes stop_codon:yes gene_type:complete